MGRFRQGRGFAPEEIIFAVTDRCNLRCGHCNVTRKGLDLDASDAVAFIKSAGDRIERIGFSGGEPFLRPEFLCAVAGYAAASGLMFDRIATNGCWWQSEEELNSVLDALFSSGFDGKIALSLDGWHGQSAEKAAGFCRAVRCFSGSGDSVWIQAVRKIRQEDDALLGEFAKCLGCGLTSFTGRNGFGSVMIHGGDYVIPVDWTPRSLLPGNPDAWKSSRWFRDDFCEGPGQVLFVHPDGRIAPCCGFANENDALILGNIKESYNQVMARATDNQMVKACFSSGLAALRKRLRSSGVRFPGKTDDMCMFCDFVCSSGFDISGLV